MAVKKASSTTKAAKAPTAAKSAQAVKAAKAGKAARAGKGSKPRPTPVSEMRAWEDDPGPPDSGLTPVAAPIPALGSGPLPVSIAGPVVAPAAYQPGTAEFRYWAAAEALRRGADLWSSASPALIWYPTVGLTLESTLDHGEDLNAYYDRRGLWFFHGRAGNGVVYSGESPDIVCHELGHAVLDGFRPHLFNANYIEVASFHESFGDMSAMLSALQLKSVRDEVIAETSGHLYQSSRLSRLAEQLGWAIRLVAPDAVEGDCLRNAVNAFFYKKPESLPPSGPASTLCSEPHSFSRVFTAAFLESLGGMFQAQSTQDEKALLQVSRDAALLLVTAVKTSPVVPSYYSQVAAHMVEVDATQFGGKYGGALSSAFVKHGILSIDSAHALAVANSSPAVPPAATSEAAGSGGEPPLHFVALAGQRYGLDRELLVPAVAETKRFGVAGAAPDVGSVDSPAHDRAAESFVEDLFRRGNVDVRPAGRAAAMTMRAGPARPSKLTHEVRVENDNLVLMRNFFDCGCRAATGSIDSGGGAM